MRAVFCKNLVFACFIIIANLVSCIHAFGKPYVSHIKRKRYQYHVGHRKLFSLEETTGEVSDVSSIKILSSGATSSPRGLFKNETFSDIFRHCAPYIAMHRKSVFVIHIASKVLEDKELFHQIMDDISILHLLGIKMVVVAGVRENVNRQVQDQGHEIRYHMGMLVTDKVTLQHVKEQSGIARFEVESALAKSFGGMTTQRGITVVSGNLFYSAKPLGVRDGVDLMLTGEVRKVEVDNIQRRLESGDIVLLTSVAYSASGEIFNVPSESLAAECAAKLKAAKIIYLAEGGLLDTKSDKPVQSLQVNEAKTLLSQWQVDKNAYNYIDEEAKIGLTSKVANKDENQDSNVAATYVKLLARCVYALEEGVTRGHLVPPIAGSLLQELFTRDGAGVLISRDVYEGIRPAADADITSILEIIKPLEAEGVLVSRNRQMLEKELSCCHVLARDGSVLACAMLIPYSDAMAEVACLAVHPSFRREGRGELLLTYLERVALKQGIRTLFVLSTRTMQWFEERGFQLADPSSLPATRNYNKERASKVYTKQLGSERDVTAEELLWNVFR